MSLGDQSVLVSDLKNGLNKFSMLNYLFNL